MFLPLAVKLLKQWTPRNWTFSRRFLLRKGEAEVWWQPEEGLISQQVVAHNSDKLSDHLEGKTGVKMMVGQ